MKVGIIVIAYDDCNFDELYKNIDKFFLSSHQKYFYLLTNKTENIYEKNVYVYYSLKSRNAFDNIVEIIDDFKKDKMELLYLCGLDIKLNFENGSQTMIPEDEMFFACLNEENKPMLYNLPALLDYIEGKETEKLYGSYTDNIIDLIKYYTKTNNPEEEIPEEEEQTT